MSLIELFITFVEKNGTLLKIYGQHDQKSAEFLEKVIHQYTETFDRQKVCEPKSGRDIYPGLVCCARYKDNKYYRAEVKSVIQLAPGYVSVFFIDYGNTERVALSDIRLLDKVQEPSFTSLHRLATEYYLAGARPITSEWDEQTISFIEEAIRYRSIKCAIVGEVIGKKLLKIFWGESDISSYLISMGAAVPVTADVQEILIETSLGIVPTRYAVPPPPVAPGIRGGPLGYPIHAAAAQYNPLVNQPIPPQGIPVSIRPPGLPIQPSIVPTPQPFSVPTMAQAKAQQFASEMLKENTEHIVYVSHVEEGPLSFAVQLKAVAEHALTELMAALNEHDPVPISRPLLPGSICLGRFSEDQSLCRAVVMHVMTDKCRLYYPDYGNSEVLPCTQIYDMPPQFIGAKVMALRFTLAGFRNIKVNQEMKDIFKELVTDRELLMKVAPMEENRTKQYCELYVNGRSVRDLMKERLAKNAVPVDYVKLHVPSRGSIERVVVSYVESPTRIVVQLESNQETLKTVMSCVATYCKDRHSIRYDQLKVNLPVCAFYPFDKTWYRAQIKEYNETEATVLFVDYGNEDVVSLTSLQRISSDLVTKVRTQALECCLAGFEMSQPNQELADTLFHIINEKTLTMQVLEVMKNQMLIVNLLDDNNVSVATYLKPAQIQAPPPVSQPAYHSPPPPVAANTGGDDDWKEEEEPEVRHPVKSYSDTQYGSGRNDGGGKRFSNDDSGKNWRANSREDPVSPRDNNKFDRFSRDDRKGSGSGGGGGGGGGGRWNSDRDDNTNWRSRDENDNRGGGGGGGGGFNRRNNDDDFRSKKFGGDSRDDGFKKWDRSGDDNNRRDGFKKWDRNEEKTDGFKKWDRNDDKSDGFKKWDRNDDKNDGFKKWDRNDNKSDGFKKWDRNDDKSDGFKKWDRNDDKSDGFKKWDRNDDTSDGFKKRDSGSSGGGFNKWNKENDRGGKPFGDGPRKFDSNRKFGSDSNDNWDSGSASRSNGAGDFNDRFSRFDSKKDSYSRQSSSKFASTAPPKKLVVPYPSIDLGDNKTVDIVYSLSPAEFFVQLSDHKDELTTLMSDIATAYTTGGSQLEKAEKGLYCVAMYSEDETWYRALIESSTDSAATVNFIDYGNIEEVPLEKLKVITAELATLPSQAIKCGLIGVRPNGDTGTWSDEEQTEFAVATEGKTLKAEFKRKTFANDTYQIVLRDVTEDESSPVVINLAFNATEDDVNVTTPGTDDVTLLPFPLAVGETIDVQVTWFLSPHLFYIQPLHTNPMFREMMEHIQEHARSYTHLLSDDLKVGKFAIARFKDDKVLYRAEIKETPMFTDPLVYFVDYGNSEKVNKQSIYNVKSEYRVMPCQAIACSLAGVSPIEEWPKVGTSKMESYFEGDSYKCSVLSQGENGNFIVSLRNQEDVPVSSLLIDNGFAVSDGVSYDLPTESAYTTVDLHLLLDQILLAHVTSVENRSKFFVQLIPAEVAKLQQELDNYTGTPENMKNVETDNITDNLLCISTIDGTSWQRASVINKNGTDGPLVLFVDSGVSKEVTNDKMYELPESLANIPYQAIECTLGVGDEGDDSSVVEGLKSEILDKDVILSVDNLDTQRLVVTVYSSEGTIIDACGEKPDGLKNVNKIVPFPVYKKHEKTFISHAESGGIYLQRIADEESIKLLLGELFDFYDPMEAIEVDWKPDDLCCAKSSADDQWYRAIVKIVEPEMTVKYLDYGNSETLTTDRLRKLDACFFKPASFALEVKMAVEWLVTEENLLELIPDKEFNTKIIRWQDGWYAELIDDSNENLTEKLVQLGFVKELENSPFIKKPSSISKLMTGTKVGVCRSHICSPSQFWVILNNDFEDLERLQDRLQNSAESMRNISGTPSSTTMIAAKLSDGIWYRVIYIPASNSVFSIDYGNTEPITEELKELPEDFLQPDGYAIPCSLLIEPIEGSWSEEAIKLFDSLITDDVLVASILKISEVIMVDLNVSDESVSKSLINQGFAVKSFLESSVYVSHVNTPSDFYVQEENPLLEQIRERLVKADEFATIADVASLKDKNLFAAQFQVDGLWYRAKLLSSDDDGVHHVIFVDYGNSDDVTEFKELPGELLEIPFMAKHCALKLPESLDNWSDHAFDVFVQLVADGATLFDIKFLDDEDPASVELTLNGELVAEQLIPQAQPETVSTDGIHKVMVCYITTPVDFWIQLETAPVNDMIDHFAQVDDWSVLEDADEGSLVAAVFEDDAQWYRAKVLSKTNDGKTKVLFVDYGNIYEASELRALPKELLEIPELAKHCSLQFSETITEWSENTLETFREITGFSSEVLDMKYIVDGDPAIVQLSIGDEDMASKLLGIEKCSNSTEKPIDDVVSNEQGLQSVVISHINSPADFYVHINRDKVDEVSTMMAEGDNFEPLNQVTVGSLVAARFLDDEVWYRATITKTDENEHIVFFVDYGNCATVKELKSLPQDIADIPHLSQLCSLQSVGEGDWSDAATDKFFELNVYGSTEFQMKVINESIPVVVELLYDGTSVSEILSQCERTDGEIDSNEKESLDELVQPESDAISSDSVDNKCDEKEVDSINYSETDDLVRQEIDAISPDIVGNKFDDVKEVDSVNNSETDDLVRQEIDTISSDSVENKFDEKEVLDSVKSREYDDRLISSFIISNNQCDDDDVGEEIQKLKDTDDDVDDDLQKELEKSVECGAEKISNGNDENTPKDESIDKKPDIVECTNSKIVSSDKVEEHDRKLINNVETDREEDVEKLEDGETNRKEDLEKLEDGETNRKEDVEKLEDGETNRKEDVEKLEDGDVKEISDNLGINVPNKTDNKNDISIAKIPLSEKIVPGAISLGTPLDEEQTSCSSDK